jgi:GINS complex subunit 2
MEHTASKHWLLPSIDLWINSRTKANPNVHSKGSIPMLQPPHRTDIPLWLALLLKRQRRANIAPPPWLRPESLSSILEIETKHSKDAFSLPPRMPAVASNAVVTSPPFLKSCTVDSSSEALPYHWLEMGEILLEYASDDFEDPDEVRRLMRDLREVRMAKLRSGVDVLDGAGGIKMNGVGGMEVAETRAFICSVVDGLR